jgi:hypothetical protein
MKSTLSKFLLVVAAIGMSQATQTAFADSARVQYPVNGHDYQRFDAERTWSNAQTHCEGLQGHLATLTSQGENDFVFQNVGQQGINIWLGGTDQISEGNWEWVTGETWSYANWSPGQPDNGLPEGQDFLIFWDAAPGMWDDNGLPRGDFLDVPFICEWEVSFLINPGLNGSWYYPETDGQGFFIDVFPDVGEMFVAWFTFDTEQPDESVDANLGHPGQRWLTAQGEYADNQAVLDIYMSGGGLFDMRPPIPEVEKDGTLTIEFSDCRNGTVTYDIPSIGRQGIVPIVRIREDNVVLCESLDEQLLQK